MQELAKKRLVECTIGVIIGCRIYNYTQPETLCPPPPTPPIKISLTGTLGQLKIQFSKRPRARQLDTTAWPKLPMSLLILWTPFWQKNVTNFWGIQFLKGLTKCYLLGINFTGEFFNTKTYKYNVTWDCPGFNFLNHQGPISWGNS